VDHLKNCPYEPIKDYLHQQQQNERNLKEEILRLQKENQSLKRQQYESQQRTDSILERLGTMFPTYFSPDLDMIPEEARSESVLVENQRVASELETLSANIASLELKQNMALMTETFRLQEELQGLRSVCHGLRMQMHYLMMDRKMASTTSAATTANATNGSQSENGTNPTGTMNSRNRMRTLLGKRS
jgi:FtsZ-binding cell division protein ZapB